VIGWASAFAVAALSFGAGAVAPTGDAESAAQLVARMRAMFPGGVFQGTPGDWAMYRMGPAPYRYWRVAVTGMEQTPQGKAYWIETSFGSQAGGALLSVKMLTRGDPRGQKVLKLYCRVGAGQTLQVDTAKLRMSAQAPEEALPPGLASPSSSQRKEAKATLAGVYSSIRLETSAGMTFWLSPDVPVFHLVALHMPVGLDMELAGVGHDAKDTLGEPVGKLNNPPPAQAAHADGGKP